LEKSPGKGLGDKKKINRERGGRVKRSGASMHPVSKKKKVLPIGSFFQKGERFRHKEKGSRKKRKEVFGVHTNVAPAQGKKTEKKKKKHTTRQPVFRNFGF